MQKLNTLYEALCEPVGNPWIHERTNWVGSFCRWESKVKIWFADGFVLWQSEDDTYKHGAMRKALAAGSDRINSM
jgi:hypothetical protein